MSALEDIKAGAVGLTGLCPDYMRMAIRHVERNCDLDCPTHGDDDEWRACGPDMYDGARIAAVLAAVPKLIAALEAIEDQLQTLDAIQKYDDTSRNACAGGVANVIRGVIDEELA